MAKHLLNWTACAIVLGTLAVAAQAAEGDAEKSHSGTVVSATATQLVVKNAAGEEKTLKVADKLTVTLDGKPAKLADLKAGTKATVTLTAAGNVTKVVATSAKPAAPSM